jgi:hypothetical protein
MSQRHMHRPIRTPRIRWQEYVARFEAEKTRQKERYCERFALWRHCPVASCRRHRTCRSDLAYCMAWAVHNLHRLVLQQAQ